MTKRGRNFLHTPGPTNIPDRILNAMHRPAIDFAAPDFLALADSCFMDLKDVFQTSGDVFIYTASGHGAWEAALVNTLSPGDRVLMPETGRFSLVWRDMTESLGIEVIETPNDWRSAIIPADVTRVLSEDKNHEIKAVLIVHTETATGVTSDIPAIRKAINAAGHPALLVVDAIASLMTVDLPMDEWGVDVVIAASQKGLMLPPGLSFTAVSAKALDVSKNVVMPREYWSWTSRLDPESYRRFCGTAPEHLIFGLRESINMIQEEGMSEVFARHARMAEAVRKAVDVWVSEGSMEFNAQVPEQRANSVTCVRMPADTFANDIRTVCRETFNVSLGGGLAALAGRAFRIGHMGDLNEPMIIGALGGVEATFQLLGVPHGKGGVMAAVDYLADTATKQQ
ncbi:MAG: alanine-glyoxylate transaminase/serine-glyoxylate transaminase/serine-pyruvate transaminase [Alphaproteobacteria bacterium]|jgi:alanine-glyoxylate transaminase/serine-glyoxylate transaminase/serine-pyruvate transaminase